MCRRVMHAGPVGSGALLKLAVNLPLMIYWQALGEQLSLCKTLTIDPAELLDFLAETSGAATVLKQRMPGIVAKLKKVPSSQRTFSPRRRHQGRQTDAGGRPEARARSAALKQTLACYEEAQRTVGGSDEVSNVSAYWAAVQNSNRISREECHEVLFVLALARDLSGAHRDEPEGLKPDESSRSI
jgi:3-hydroxyisobutyrate dehydrogenase